MSKLTEASRDQECTLQIFPYCQGGTETTVPAHLPCEDKGVGYKSPDWWLADGCRTCHDIIDGRMQVDLPQIEIERCQMRGLYRTLKRRIETGLIKI